MTKKEISKKLTIDLLYEYCDTPSILETKISEFSTKTSFTEDIQLLKELQEDEDFEKLKVVFYTKVLAKTVKTANELKMFYGNTINFMNKNNTNVKFVMVLLNVVKSVTNKKYYISSVFNLLAMLSSYLQQSIKCKDTNKKAYTIDDLKVTSDDLKNVNFVAFVINELLLEIRNQMEVYENNIGYPEIAFIVAKELRKLKNNEYKEFVADAVKEITERAAFVEEKRKEYFSGKFTDEKKKKELTYEEAMKFEKMLKDIIE